MDKKEKKLKLYNELADWFHLLTPPCDYKKEAQFYRKMFIEKSVKNPITVLELGSGGGNNASHLKKYFKLTLTDISPKMLKISKKINPECEHILGDMRKLRLNRKFDVVFVQDAISYITNKNDLLKVFKTAFAHCRDNGIAVFCPDFFQETFKSGTSCDGSSENNRGLRYLEWIHSLDIKNTTYIHDLVYFLIEGKKFRIEHDRHIMGIFKHSEWMDILVKAGFRPINKKLSTKEKKGIDYTNIIIALKPENNKNS